MSSDRRSIFTRMRERVRYGLFTQEALDRLARLGFIYYPYYLVRERALEEPSLDDAAGALSFARLGPDRARLIAEMPCRPMNMERVLSRMERAACYGVFHGTDLAGYTWADLGAVTAPLTLAALFPLGERGAYLCDMYIARAHRGRRLAPWLRYMTYRELMNEGRDELYSVTLAHNASSRRFKQRLGAVEIEKRLAVGLSRVLVHDRRTRALTSEPLPSPRLLRVRGGLRRR